VNNIDLPDYLKNSKLLNNLSVRQLLQYWALICATAVVILSLAAVITNDLISDKQAQLNKTAIPIDTAVRSLGNILTSFELREEKLLAAKNKDELENYLSRQNLDQSFNDQLSRLSSRVSELHSTTIVLNELQKDYKQFLLFDDEFTNIFKTTLEEGNVEELSLIENLELARITESMDASRQVIEADLKRLSDIGAEYTKMMAEDSLSVSQVNLMVVVTLSLIVIAIIIAGISLVLYRINEPLAKVRNAMHDLSYGDMTRRLKEENIIKDEFSELSVDFNRFAERTQLLFDDVTNAKDALEGSEKRTRAILENALVGIAHLKDRKILTVNKKFEELFDYERETIEGKRIESLYPSEDDYQALNDAAYKLMADGDTYHGEWQMKQRDGNLFWCDVSAKAISENIDEDGTIWLFEDVTQRKRSEEELRRLANYDTLTDLPNRSLFQDRLLQAMGRARRLNKSIALIYIDLDRFKKINDSFGHSAGDDLLKIVSKRLCECVRGSDTVSRLGGDEFTIILPEIQSMTDAGKVSEKIIFTLDEPFKLNDQEVTISPSIGISLFPDDASDMDSLLRNADAAMYHAKSSGRNNYQYYTQEMNAEARHRLDVEGRLRKAIDNGDFLLYYQPQIDVESLTVTGYEALIRWEDGKNGLVSPNEFVPLLEDTGLIVPVGEWILFQSCSDIEKIHEVNNDFQSISVNLSARQFIDNTLVSRMENVLQKTGVSSKHLVIEITETIMMTETERSMQILNELSELGLKLSLDDFGTGYSSLAYLKRFPIDVIKIDQSFVRDLHDNPSDAAICEAIIAIARRLGLKVVAEGVETQQQFDFMRERNCHSIQGYFFGRPVPLNELVSEIDEQRLMV